MKSPLNGSYYQPQGEVYLSDQPAFQEMQGKIQAAADQVMANWTDEDQETKLSNRIQRRKDREIVREDRRKLVSFDEDGKLLKGDARKMAISDKRKKRFAKKTEELEERKTDVTNKITAAMRKYEADKILFGNTAEGIKKLNKMYPQGPPRTNS